MVQLGYDLDSRGPGPDNDDRQELAPADRIALHDRPLEEPDHVVPDGQGIRDRSQRQSMGLELLVAEEVRGASERHDEVVVRNGQILDPDDVLVQVKLPHLALNEVKPALLRKRAERVAHVRGA